MSDQLVRVSPSQLSLAMLCWRKWAFAYIYGLREPETWQLALGTFVHALLEAYLRDGTVPDPYTTWTHDGTTRTFYPGKIALNMMPAGIFPPPGAGHVEYKFEYNDGRGIVWNGLLDWHAVLAGVIVIIDHKTSSDPQKWGKLGDADSEHEEYALRALRNDVQPIIYGRAMLERYGDLPVEAHWNYGSTQHTASASRVSTARFTPAELRDVFETRVRPVGEEIRRLRLMNADPLSLDPNPDACSAYHKECPHVATCNLTTAQRIGNIVMGNPLVDGLLAEAANAGAAPAPPQPPPPPVAPGGVNPPEASAPPQPPALPLPPVAAPPPQPPALPLPPVAPPQPPVAPPQPPVAPPQPPVAPPQPQSTAVGHGVPPTTPKPDPKPKRGKAPKASGDNGLAVVLAQLAEIRAVDDDLADAVAAKLADKLAEKLLGDL